METLLRAKTRLASPRGFLQAGYNQIRTIGAILMREAGLRHGKSFAFGFVSDAIEPLMIIAVICFVRWVLANQPKYGTDIILFTATGVFPSWLWMRTSLAVAKPVALTENLRYPRETDLDRIVVAGLLHLMNSTLCAVIFFYWLYAGYGDKNAMPFDPWTAITVMLLLFIFGLGVGLINSVLGEFVPIWSGLWAAIARGLMHFSAIFFVPDFLPPNTRNLFTPNPVLHGVSWFRHAFYPEYPNTINDHNYVILLTLITLPLGLLAVQYLGRRDSSGIGAED